MAAGAIEKFDSCCLGKEIILNSDPGPEEFTGLLIELHQITLSHLIDKSNSEVLMGAALCILAAWLLLTIRKSKHDL
jgi:hypothetical protein